MMQTGKGAGMCTLEMALQELVKKNLIDKSYLPKSAFAAAGGANAA
jgi:hypothetical protein